MIYQVPGREVVHTLRGCGGGFDDDSLTRELWVRAIMPKDQALDCLIMHLGMSDTPGNNTIEKQACPRPPPPPS